MNEATTVLYTAVQIYLPVILWGISGTGKTSKLKQLEAALQRRLWALSLAELEPTDLIGFPVVAEMATGRGFEKVVRFAPPAWAREVAEAGGGIVLLDELNRVASQQVMNAGQRIIHERQCGELRLPEKTSFVAACNPSGRSGTLPVTSAFANRCLHVPWSVPYSEWKAGVEAGWPVEMPRIVPPSWQALVPAKSSLITGFLLSRPALHVSEPEDPHDAGQAWPSGRTWEMAWMMMAALDAIGYGDKSAESLLAVRAAVGEAAGDEWRQYITTFDLPNPEDALANPDTFQLPERQDYVLVVLASIAKAALDTGHPPKARVARYRAAWKVVGRAAKVAKDLVVPCARSLALGCPREVGNNLPKEIDEVMTILERSGVQWGAHAVQ